MSEKGDLEEQFKKLSAENANLQARLGERSEVCKVTAKIPPFWPHKPIIWFATVEAQFDIAGIVTDRTKYSYILGHLDQKYSQEVEDIITNPPPEGQRYEKLKLELIRRLSMSEEERVRQLVSDEELGDRKPSQFLRHLRSLAGNTFTDENILKQLWLRRLPQTVQAILSANTDILSLDRMAEMADKVMEVMGHKQVASCSTIPTPSLIDTLISKVDELTKQVAALSTARTQGRSRSRGNSTARADKSRDNTPADQKLCWYHKKFNKKASKCTKPCNWSENQSDSQ